MSTVFADLGVSMDGFVAGPNSGPGNALGDGGERIHRWAYGLESWRERQNRSGGRESRDGELVREIFERAGAYVMGRRMFDEGEVEWPDPPPFRAPVFVATHHARAPWVRQGGTTFTFVTDGIASTVEQARAAAGDQDVQISGGADTVWRCLLAGLLDELQLHIAPVLLGDGVRLFGRDVPDDVSFEPVRVVESPQVTHIRYRIVRA